MDDLRCRVYGDACIGLCSQRCSLMMLRIPVEDTPRIDDTWRTRELPAVVHVRGDPGLLYSWLDKLVSGADPVSRPDLGLY